ncbi:MAG: PD40 domain-containing protein [Phycisphaeraceae bacterium]|nr:PD40 domain-containing protein [Phycisphaeraceae bacterium]
MGFPQTPSISPDGSLVVFAWSGDLWAVDSHGGLASRLTAHPAEEGRSAFGPDGKTLAFESDRDGATNLYTMRLQRVGGAIVGTDIRRVTVSDRSQSLGGFSADGTTLYYSASRDPEIYRHAKMYAAPISGGPVVELSGAFGLSPRATPDGRAVLFTRGYGSIWNRPKYRGPGTMDVFRFDTTDGSFYRVTTNSANDGEAFGLSDGSVVFVSSRDGQNNLYRLPLERPGGRRSDGVEPQQLTSFAPGREGTSIAHGIRDLDIGLGGDRAVFCVWDQMYTLDVSRPGATPERLEVTVSQDSGERDFVRMNLSGDVDEAAMSPDGKAIAMIARGKVFVRSVEEGRPTRRVTRGAARERDLVFSPDGEWLYFASDESGVWNLYRARVSMTRQDVRPDSQESDADVEPAGQGPAAPVGALDPVSGDWNCQVSGRGLPEGISSILLTLTLNDNAVGGRIVVPNMLEAPVGGTFDRATGTIALSVEIDGQTATIEASLSDGTLTGTAGFAGMRFSLSGTRSGGAPAKSEGDTAAADGAKEEKPTAEPRAEFGIGWASSLRFEVQPLVATEHNDRRPVPSPDGRSLAFVRGRGDLMLLDLNSRETRTVLEGWDEPEVIWASDARHVVFARADLDFNTDIWLLDVMDPAASAVNITRHPDTDTSPRLSADGKMLVFLSDRAGENGEFDVWGVNLDAALDAMTDYELDDYVKEAASRTKKRGAIQPVDSSKAPEATEPQAFDTQDAYLRVRRITSLPGSEGSLELTPGGDRILFGASIDGSYALRSVDHRGRDRKTVHSAGARDLRVSPGGGWVTFVGGGSARSASPTGGDAKAYPIDAPVVIDIAQQQRQKFLEMARILGEGFYHPTLKGLDWQAITRRYLELAMRTRTSQEFNRVGNLLLGELDGSHLGISGGDGYSAGSESIGHLGVDTEPAPGGYRVTRVLKGSPAAREVSAIREGDVIVAVEGEPLALTAEELPARDLRDALRGCAGREVLVDVLGPTGEPRLVLIEPISYGALTSMAYEQEVLDRRAEVEALSGGRLGYLHIRGMSEPSVRDFERDLYAAAHRKEGLIIDVRDNGGGWTTDILLASLTAPRHAITVPRGASKRDAFPDAYPRDRRLIYAYQRPISVLINQHSFSNAEIFAHAIKTIGRGRLVGTQTFGGVISTGAARLIDGTSVRLPFRGWYLPDGTDMEHHGAVPDVDVPQTPADEAAGRDPQLEAAVAELLGRVAQSADGLWHPGE